jgi:hypothetical protein
MARRRSPPLRRARRSRVANAPDPFPELLPGPPDGEGRWDRSRTPSAIKADLEAARRRDWIAESFGSGEAATFIRRAQTDQLTLVQALLRLRKEMFAFRDLRELEVVANELMRSEKAGRIVARELTWKVLHRLLGSR